MSERRPSTICAVVEQPDHHCGEDLVYYMKRYEAHDGVNELTEHGKYEQNATYITTK